MLDENQIASLRGSTLVAGSSDVGEIAEVYSHAADDLPAVVAVRAEGRRVLVPLPVPEARVEEGRVTVPFDADTVAGAPEATGDAVAGDQLSDVYAHFGISDAAMREDTGHEPGGRAA